MVSQSISSRKKGFTIVEMIVVIVVISILAAITVFAYNSVKKETISTTLKDDLRSGASKIESYKAEKGRYPGSLYDLNNGAGISASGSNNFRYVETGYYQYCLEVSTNDNEFVYSLSSEDDVVDEENPCPALQDL